MDCPAQEYRQQFVGTNSAHKLPRRVGELGVPGSSDKVVNALKRLGKEVSYMLAMDTDETKDLIISAETQLALDEAEKALKEIGESIEYDDD